MSLPRRLQPSLVSIAVEGAMRQALSQPAMAAMHVELNCHLTIFEGATLGAASDAVGKYQPGGMRRNRRLPSFCLGFSNGRGNLLYGSFTRMVDFKDANDVIASLKRENAELSGLALATGVILTQLLQSICKRELNPQAAAGRIMSNAREAIEGFTNSTHADPVMKQRALDAVKQYEEQIRSVLAV
jgi:hypothetical protein